MPNPVATVTALTVFSDLALSLGADAPAGAECTSVLQRFIASGTYRRTKLFGSHRLRCGLMEVFGQFRQHGPSGDRTAAELRSAPPGDFHSLSFSGTLLAMGITGHDKIRLDRLLVERGLADSREKAQAMILAGQVLVDEQKVEKCGVLTSARAKLRLVGEPLKYAGGAYVPTVFVGMYATTRVRSTSV